MFVDSRDLYLDDNQITVSENSLQKTILFLNLYVCMQINIVNISSKSWTLFISKLNMYTVP